MTAGGPYDAPQAAADVIDLAESLGWQSFTWVAHSMSTVPALHLACCAPMRVERLVLIGPPPPGGGASPGLIEAAKRIAFGDDEERIKALQQMWGSRLSMSWISLKAQQWRESAEPQAVADYVDMFARDGVPDLGGTVEAPVIAIAGNEDPNELMRPGAVRAALQALCPRLTVRSIENCGHYPMQEAPPIFASLVERAVTGAFDRP